jgi:2-alkenal reductase
MKNKKLFLSIFVIAALLLGACSAASALTTPVRQVVSAVQAPAPRAISAPVQAATAAPSTNSTTNSTSNTTAGLSIDAYQSVLENVYSQVGPSVVNIEVTSSSSLGNTQGNGQFQSPFGDGNGQFGFGNSAPTQQALGSGFVWDNQGHIVTNNHVVAGADQIMVTFADGTTVQAKLVGADPNSDLAVIQVNVPASELHPVTLMDSSQVKVGQLAIAIGNPYGLSGTMTVGIVSALSRSLPVGLDNPNQTGPTYAIPDIIQTDASINPGNSGGVLVNDQGQLMGVTAAIQSNSGSNSGIGFVIPSNIVNKVIPSLIQTGKYQHPYLGIAGTTLTPDLAQANNLPASQQGVLVMEVASGGPAAKAGIQGGASQNSLNGQTTMPTGGDVITAVNGTPVTKFEDLSSYLFNNTKVGQAVTLTILRSGHQQSVQVTLGAQPTQ